MAAEKTDEEKKGPALIIDAATDDEKNKKTEITSSASGPTTALEFPAPAPTPDNSPEANDGSLEGGSQKPMPQYKGLFTFSTVYTGNAFQDWLQDLFGFKVVNSILGKVFKSVAAVFLAPLAPFFPKIANFVKNNGLLLAPLAAVAAPILKGVALVTGSEGLNRAANACGQLIKNSFQIANPEVEVPGEREEIEDHDERPVPVSLAPLSEKSTSPTPVDPLAKKLESTDAASRKLRETPEGEGMPEKEHHETLGLSEETKHLLDHAGEPDPGAPPVYEPPHAVPAPAAAPAAVKVVEPSAPEEEHDHHGMGGFTGS